MQRPATASVRNIRPNKPDNVVLTLEHVRQNIVETTAANDKAENNYWLLKLWLYGVITVNLLNILNHVIARYVYQVDLHAKIAGSLQLTQIIIFAAIANTIFAIALLQFQKWGFWGLVATGFSMLIVQINLGAATVLTVVLTLFSLSILYGLLRPGGKDDAWFKLA